MGGTNVNTTLAAVSRLQIFSAAALAVGPGGLPRGDRIVAAGGFTSEHFTEDRLRALLGPCELHAIGEIAYMARC